MRFLLFALFSFFFGREIFPHPEEEIFRHPEGESFGIGRGNLSLNHGDIPISMLN